MRKKKAAPIKSFRRGQTLTAQRLNEIVRAVNRIARKG